jgi:PAS domain S-box-containing protein
MECPISSEQQRNPDARQNQMAQAFRNFQQCIQYCQKAVFFTDAAGILQRVNPAFEKLTGFISAESVGKDLSWMAAEGPSSDAYRRIWHEIFENRAFRGTLEVRRRDGNSFPMELTAIPVRDTKGQIISLVCTGRDIRQECRAESKFAETSQLNAVSTVASAVVHEFNNLLMVISYHARLALNALPAEHVARKSLEEIEAAVQRSAEITGERREPDRPVRACAAGASAD